MEKEWAELNKEMQMLLGKEATYKEGVQKLLVLREELLNRIGQMVNGFPEEAFWKMCDIIDKNKVALPKNVYEPIKSFVINYALKHDEFNLN